MLIVIHQKSGSLTKANIYKHPRIDGHHQSITSTDPHESPIYILPCISIASLAVPSVCSIFHSPCCCYEWKTLSFLYPEPLFSFKENSLSKLLGETPSQNIIQNKLILYFEWAIAWKIRCDYAEIQLIMCSISPMSVAKKGVSMMYLRNPKPKHQLSLQ